MTISGKFFGSDQAIVLSEPDGRGSYIIPAEAINYWTWRLNFSALVEDVTAFGDSTPRSYSTMRDIHGTIEFSAMNIEHCAGHIDPDEPIIKEYSVSDMLRMVRTKLGERK